MAPSKSVVVATDAVSATPEGVDPDQALKASKALLAHIKKAAREKLDAPGAKRSLFNLGDDDDATESVQETPVWLTLTTKRHLSNRTRLHPGKIALPHPLIDPTAAATTTVCAITADPQRAYKNIIGSDEFPEALRRRITRVIDYSKLRAKYNQYEAQRKLFSEHDVFVADDRIINRLPKVLGKTFYKTTAKRPIPVILQARRPKVDGKRVKKRRAAAADDDDEDVPVNAASAADIATEIEKALGSALISRSPSTNTAVRVGYAHWPPEHIAANINVIVPALVDRYVPQKWRNVKGIFIKGPSTAALPLWQTDELWLAGYDVKPDLEGGDAAAAARLEKPNVGKKRKSIAAAGADDKNKGGDEDAPAPKKKKKQQQEESSKPTSNDAQLDKSIAERQAKLRRQKAAAKKAMEEED